MTKNFEAIQGVLAELFDGVSSAWKCEVERKSDHDRYSEAKSYLFNNVALGKKVEVYVTPYMPDALGMLGRHKGQQYTKIFEEGSKHEKHLFFLENNTDKTILRKQSLPANAHKDRWDYKAG